MPNDKRKASLLQSCPEDCERIRHKVCLLSTSPPCRVPQDRRNNKFTMWDVFTYLTHCLLHWVDCVPVKTCKKWFSFSLVCYYKSFTEQDVVALVFIFKLVHVKGWIKAIKGCLFSINLNYFVYGVIIIFGSEGPTYALLLLYHTNNAASATPAHHCSTVRSFTTWGHQRALK